MRECPRHIKLFIYPVIYLDTTIPLPVGKYTLYAPYYAKCFMSVFLIILPMTF